MQALEHRADERWHGPQAPLPTEQHAELGPDWHGAREMMSWLGLWLETELTHWSGVGTAGRRMGDAQMSMMGIMLANCAHLQGLLLRCLPC